MRTAKVDVWTIRLSEERAMLLSSDEETRAARFHFEIHRLRWRRARSALRETLAMYVEREALALQFACNPHGKPSIEGVHFNLSHADEYAMIAVSKDIPVGVDIERFRANVDMVPLLERLGETGLQGDAAALHQRWVRREAASKAQGRSLWHEIDSDISIVDLTAPKGYFAALAAAGAEPVPRYCAGGR